MHNISIYRCPVNSSKAFALQSLRLFVDIFECNSSVCILFVHKKIHVDIRNNIGSCYATNPL